MLQGEHVRKDAVSLMSHMRYRLEVRVDVKNIATVFRIRRSTATSYNNLSNLGLLKLLSLFKLLSLLRMTCYLSRSAAMMTPR